MHELNSDESGIASYLRSQGWLSDQEEIRHLEAASADPMCFRLRVSTNHSNFILKQYRKPKNKQPMVASARQRSLAEKDFYNIISREGRLQQRMPRLLAVDEINQVLMLEDPGTLEDFSDIYQAEGVISQEELAQVVDFAATLHQITLLGNGDSPLPNRKLRELRHEQIFVVPYLRKNGIDLDTIMPGQQEIADDFQGDKRLLAAIAPMARQYLADGRQLLHGNYYPGNWLRSEDGLRVIDPAFAFYGSAEFDLGVCLAHLKLAGQPAALVTWAENRYADQAPIDLPLSRKFMACEILHRFFGHSQIPLSLHLERRAELAEEARQLLLRS